MGRVAGLAAFSLSACLIGASASAGDRLAPLKEQVLEDAVYTVELKRAGQWFYRNVGESNRRVVRRGGTLVAIEQQRLNLAEDGAPREIRSDSVTVEDLAGRLIEFDHVDLTKQIFGKVTAGKMTVSHTEGESTTRRTREVPVDMFTENGNVRRLVAEGGRIGRRWTMKEFSANEALKGPRMLDFELMARETRDFRGERIALMKFKQTEREQDDPWTTLFWVDAQGVMFRLESENSQISVRYIRTR